MTDAKTPPVEAMPVIHLNEENFNAFASQIPNIVIDFWAEWCGPCKRFAPVFEEVHTEYPEVQFCKCNTDECPNVANQYHISAIPTIFFVKSGTVQRIVSGALSAERLREELNRVFRQ
ncbi:MAG TPA: thioredoxin [Methanocorpusculum sp.]|nr:thioredoxin [Methanocorpusculum sp.]